MPREKKILPSGHSYLVDTCVFIHAFCDSVTGSSKEIVEACRLLFQHAEAKDIELYISVVTIAEALSNKHLRSDDPRRPKSTTRRNEEYAQLMAWLDKYTSLVEVDRGLALAAGQAGRENLLKGADAIIYMSAIEAGVDALITTDKGLLKVDGPNMPVVRPQDIGGQDYLPIESL